MSFDWSKHLMSFPIIGLILYYVGGVLVLLRPDWNPGPIFLQLILFSVISIVSLMFRHRELMILGSIVICIGSINPFFYFLRMFQMIAGIEALGGLIMTVAVPFHLLTLNAWYKEG